MALITKAMSLCAAIAPAGRSSTSMPKWCQTEASWLIDPVRYSQFGTVLSPTCESNARVYASEVYVGLATTATSSVSLALDPSSVSATRISAAMTGQSVVQTGSRNASRTTLPRRLASETCRPVWLVSVKFGAGLSS